MIFNESMLEEYSKPLSETENSQCKNAIRMVADALKKLGFTDDNAQITPLYPDTYAYSLQLRQQYGSRRIKVFVQGSYANNTNVRQQSDVDVAVIQEEVFQTEYRGADSQFPQSDSDYKFTRAFPAQRSFKDEVQDCLVAKFGTDVERKNKSIKVHGNTYRKDADTVPCRRYRDYTKDYLMDPENYVGGIVIIPDKGDRIVNYPEQHIANGRTKNTATHQFYKKMVRIVKKMRYLMEDSWNDKYRTAAKNVSSFLLESLLWNIDNQWYIDNCGPYRKVYAFYLLIGKLRGSKHLYRTYHEANGIKPLCPNDEVYANLCQFMDALSEFYDYE